MFVERKVCYSALLTNLVRWHAGAVSFPLSDVTLAQLACPRSDIMFCLLSVITNLYLYKHWVNLQMAPLSLKLFLALLSFIVVAVLKLLWLKCFLK
jgi:hypothetical protein